jgi:hypothetical protein
MPFRIAIHLACIVWVTVWTAGCATRNQFVTPTLLPDSGSNRDAFLRAEQTIKNLYPSRYRATQRAIITAGGKQFTCDGLLQVSPAEGHHLAIVSSFGVVTDLRVNPVGDCTLLKITPLFREEWSRRFVARDLHRLFGAPDDLQPAGLLAGGNLVLQTRPDSAGVTARYVFSADGSRWLELDLLQAGEIFYRAIPKNFLKQPGMPMDIPRNFDVNAEAYRLELNLTELIVTTEDRL